MDWVTVTRQQIEHDALPPVCMECGQPATCRVSETFSHTPEWVGWLYWAGFIPGLIAHHFLTQEMRVACPFCERHRNHWRRMYWLAGLGWLVGPLLGAGLGFGIGAAFWFLGEAGPFIALGVGAGLGLIVWLVLLIRIATSRIDASKITVDEITFQGVHDTFAKAAMDQGFGSSASPAH
jgi:hypothetical protein